MKRTRTKIGEQLLKDGLITPEQIKQALEEQKSTGKLLGEIIANKGWASREAICKIIASQLEVEFVDLNNFNIPPDIIGTISEKLVRKYSAIPIKKEGNTVVLAMSMPQDIFAIDEIRAETRFKVTPVLGIPSQIAALIDKYYGGSAIEETLTVIKDKEISISSVMAEEEDIEKMRQSAETPPIVKLVDAFISDAIRERASDVHIEPTKEAFKVRFRIDGVLHTVSSPPTGLYAAVVSRVKIMANMDIAERRIPQDGRFRVMIGRRDIDVRVSSYPSVYGEKIVMRLLVKEYALVDLKALGFEPDDLEKANSLIQKTCGIILVVGPTGSGKSTTLYSALNQINSPQRNIITVEDPVEYKIDGLVQSQVNLKAGFNFANSLRAMMRQDPDVIMVGEMRDLDTAELAIRAALTGHLVLSTLHTNDAPSTITRLVDMGIEPYLISATLIGVVAQRLIRKICPRCKAPCKDVPPLVETFRAELEDIGKKIGEREHKFYHGRGCEFCRNTGYRGRDGTFEVMPISEVLREAIAKGEGAMAVKDIARKEGMATLKENGLAKALKGITSVEEAVRVITFVS